MISSKWQVSWAGALPHLQVTPALDDSGPTPVFTMNIVKENLRLSTGHDVRHSFLQDQRARGRD